MKYIGRLAGGNHFVPVKHFKTGYKLNFFLASLLVKIQSTQCGFYIFLVATADKFYLARTVAGDSKPKVAVIVR